MGSTRRALRLPPARVLAADITLILFAALFVWAILEISFRVIDFDFDQQDEAFHQLPPFFRQPSIPVGPVFFRRPGPETWTGQVLYQGLKWSGGLDDAYHSEPPVTVSYDGQGFRNPENLTDWDIVVVGDSFVELGFLPYEDLFTTRLGKLLNLHVKNLGVSDSGLLTYNYLLNEYGKAEHARVALMVFYEGNDINDLMNERDALMSYQTSGKRAYRTISKQSSFTLAVQRKLSGWVPPSQNRPQIFQNAYFTSPAGEIPITVSASAPGKGDLSDDQKTALANALADWARIARGMGMSPGLVYMPAKRRVLDGHLRLTPRALSDGVQLPPSNLPTYIKELCDQSQIKFIDVTPSIAVETAKGTLTYNAIWDTHVNRVGAEIVAQTIADALSVAR